MGSSRNGASSVSCCTSTEIAPPAVEPPDGVEIVTWAERPELARGIYEVALEALPDIPGSEDDEVEPFEDWLAHDMQGSGDRPEATFVAVAGEEVVGWAKFSLTAAQPTTAHHDLSAVKRAWRGRGIAGALKAAQINWAIANGYTGAAHPQRAAERADPAPERSARLPARNRPHLPRRADRRRLSSLERHQPRAGRLERGDGRSATGELELRRGRRRHLGGDRPDANANTVADCHDRADLARRSGSVPSRRDAGGRPRRPTGRRRR